MLRQTVSGNLDMSRSLTDLKSKRSDIRGAGRYLTGRIRRHQRLSTVSIAAASQRTLDRVIGPYALSKDALSRRPVEPRPIVDAG